jgi:hypothetical protein
MPAWKRLKLADLVVALVPPGVVTVTSTASFPGGALAMMRSGETILNVATRDPK